MCRPKVKHHPKLTNQQGTDTVNDTQANAGAPPGGPGGGGPGGGGPGGGPGGGDGGPPGGGDGGPGGATPGQTTSDECIATFKEDGSCMDDGSSYYADVQLEYSSETGLFTGQMITNQCNAKPNPEFHASPTCVLLVRSLIFAR